jgi:hypothetical protein
VKYILTEISPIYGHKGLFITKEQYIAIPYYDRALFEPVTNEGDYPIICEVAVYDKLRETYLLMHELALKEFMDAKDIEESYGIVLAKIKLTGTWVIFHLKYQYTFKLIHNEPDETN